MKRRLTIRCFLDDNKGKTGGGYSPAISLLTKNSVVNADYSRCLMNRSSMR